MKTRVFLIGCILLVATALSPVVSEPLSKVAVVDIEAIFDSYPDDAEIFEELDELMSTYEEQIGLYTERIEELNRRIDDARDADDDLTAEGLINERNELIADRALYSQIMNRKLVAAYKAVPSGFADDIVTAIGRVAVDEGFSLVLMADDSRLIWFSQEIVITDLVINRLQAIAR